MDRRRFLAGFAAGASLAGCVGQGATTTPTEYDVGMTASAFDPVRVEVRVGETVTWRNTNSRAHTVTAYGANLPEGGDYFASGGFDTERAARSAYFDSLGGALYTGDTFEHTFGVAGRYDYFCVPHERAGMRGVVVVRE